MATKHALPGSTPPFPHSLSGTDKRSAILRAAHTLFLRDGFGVTSMDAVTRQAGVSKATVYAYFPSKHALFETLIREGSEDALKSIPPLVRRGGDPAAELLAFFEPFLTMLFTFGGYYWERMVLAESIRHPENARLFYTCTIERIGTTVENYFRELIREGLLFLPDAPMCAEALLSAAVLGPMHRVIMLGPEAVDYRRSLRCGIELILKNRAPVNSEA